MSGMNNPKAMDKITLQFPGITKRAVIVLMDFPYFYRGLRMMLFKDALIAKPVQDLLKDKNQ